MNSRKCPCIAVCCSVLQCVAACCCALQCRACSSSSERTLKNAPVLQCAAVCWEFVAVCCSMLQCVAVSCSVVQCQTCSSSKGALENETPCILLNYVTSFAKHPSLHPYCLCTVVCCCASYCGAVRCSMLQRVTVCYNVLQYVAACM